MKKVLLPWTTLQTWAHQDYLKVARSKLKATSKMPTRLLNDHRF